MSGDRDDRDGEAVVPLEDAVRVLNALQRAVRKRQREGADARLLAQLQRQSERRRAPEPEGGGDDDQ